MGGIRSFVNRWMLEGLSSEARSFSWSQIDEVSAALGSVCGTEKLGIDLVGRIEDVSGYYILILVRPEAGDEVFLRTVCLGVHQIVRVVPRDARHFVGWDSGHWPFVWVLHIPDSSSSGAVLNPRMAFREFSGNTENVVVYREKIVGNLLEVSNR